MLNLVPNVGSLISQSASDIPGLPRHEAQEWREKANEISEWWDWFTGAKLQERKRDRTDPTKEALLYPLQINPINLSCALHSYALAGDVPDTSEPLVAVIVDSEDKDLAERARKLLLRVDNENHTRTSLADAFLSIQALGAIVLKIGWDGFGNPFRPTGLRYEYYDPRDVWCHTDGSDYWNLTEAWIRQVVTKEDAARMGVTIERETGEYIEYWDRERYWIRIDGKIAKDQAGPLDRAHNWGFVPLIYVPHMRANGFHGLSLVPGGVGLTIELNSRLADIGDAMTVGVNDLTALVNVRPGFPIVKEIKGGHKYLDLGRATMSSDPEPKLMRPPTPELPTYSMDFVSLLIESVRISQLTPEVTFGKEEGTQRSGATLHNRFWPFLSHISSERSYWTEALNLRSRMALAILAKQKRGISLDELSELEFRQEWAPMVPLDRAQLVQELMQRWQAGAISLELLLEKFGDIPNLEEEIERITRLKDEEMARQQQLMQSEAALKQQTAAKSKPKEGKSNA